MTWTTLARWAAALTAVAGTALAASPPAGAAAPDDEVLVIWSVSDQDADGFTAQAQIRNLTPELLRDWQVELPFAHQVVDITGAVSVQDGASLLLTSGKPLLPGHTRTVRLSVVSAGGQPRAPISCTASDASCRVVLAEPEPAEPAPTPSPTVVATPSPTPAPSRSRTADPELDPCRSAAEAPDCGQQDTPVLGVIPWDVWRL